MRCPHCREKLLQKSQDGGVRLRITGQVYLDAEGARAQCHWCKGTVTLPLQLSESVAKAEPRLTIKTHSRK